jgi:hypothetical protein
VQVPDAAQHAPVGWTHGLGLHAANIVQAPAQLIWVVTKQRPVGIQQEPVGNGQGFGAQVVPPPRQVLGASHPAWIVTVQVPTGAQHAPVGWTHGFGLQRPNIVQA